LCRSDELETSDEIYDSDRQSISFDKCHSEREVQLNTPPKPGIIYGLKFMNNNKINSNNDNNKITATLALLTFIKLVTLFTTFLYIIFYVLLYSEAHNAFYIIVNILENEKSFKISIIIFS
jgi:hypothetical protein